MKKIVLLLVAVAVAAPASSKMARGYIRKSGTYVAPSFKTTPNSTKLDNYSTKGNVNPYSGRKGSVDPFKPRKFK